jgi:thioredoxin reductase (NADPH)
MKYEVIVIGSGAAGLSAGIFLSRAGIKTLIVGDQKKSQLPSASEIRNLFGFPEGINGPELIKRGIKHAKQSGATLLQVHATQVKQLPNETFKVKLDNSQTHEANYIVICSGLLSHHEFANPLNLKTYKKHLIKVDQNNKTSNPKVYAAGNCTTQVRQIAKDIGEGCNAAISIIKIIKNLPAYTDYGPLEDQGDK